MKHLISKIHKNNHYQKAVACLKNKENFHCHLGRVAIITFIIVFTIQFLLDFFFHIKLAS
ncbi:MAG: hypothetical protein U9Q15_03175 [Patescibacteria group bacterium]|nr:hypothetical protein [Patescibacteria group bacterium]